jgi:hypothetical protein
MPGRLSTLPKNNKIRILAISVANDNPEFGQVAAMFNSLGDKIAGSLRDVAGQISSVQGC